MSKYFLFAAISTTHKLSNEVHNAFDQVWLKYSGNSATAVFHLLQSVVNHKPVWMEEDPGE